MKFTHNNQLFAIEFTRFHKDVEREATKLSSNKPKSTHPYTRVDVIEIDPANPSTRKIYRTATVGCYHKDPFTLEKGRLRALRLLSRTPKLDASFKEALWDAYLNRGVIRKPVIDAEVIHG